MHPAHPASLRFSSRDFLARGTTIALPRLIGERPQRTATPSAVPGNGTVVCVDGAFMDGHVAASLEHFRVSRARQ
jgi:hypothetical protein